MTEEELWDALDGLHAYDTGCLDFGIKDERLRARVKEHLTAAWARESHEIISRPAVNTLSRFVRERMLSDEALEQGYGLEDVSIFIRWLCEYMDICL